MAQRWAALVDIMLSSEIAEDGAELSLFQFSDRPA